MTDSERDVVIRANTIKHFEKNQIIDISNGSSETSYFVIEGALCSYTSLKDREVVSEFFLQGEPVLTTPNSQYLRCLEDCILAASSASEGEKQLEAFPRFETVCRKFAEDRLAYQVRFSEQLRSLSPLERYEFVSLHRPELLRRVPQHALASYLGIAPETLSRTRRQFLDL